MLNVFTPKNATPDSQLPVMLFIHGGNFKQVLASRRRSLCFLGLAMFTVEFGTIATGIRRWAAVRRLMDRFAPQCCHGCNSVPPGCPWVSPH